METNNQFKRNGILIGHDVDKQTLLFAYKGETPTLMGRYYLVHHTELHELRVQIQHLISVAEEMQDVLNEQDKLIEEQGKLIDGLIKSICQL